MNIKRLLLNVLRFGTLIIGVEWFFNLGIRLYLVEVYSILFIGLCVFFHKVFLGGELPRNMALLLKLLWGSFFFVVLTGSFIFIGPLADIPGAYDNYLKAVAQLSVRTLFLFCAGRFMATLSYNEMQSVLRYYVFGVILCAVYGITQAILFSLLQIDVDMYVWPIFWSDWDPATGISRYAWGPFYRIKGWAQEPNVFASYIASAFPLVLLSGLGFKWFSGLLLSLSLVLSQSLSGIGGAIFGFLALIRRLSTLLKVIIPAILAVSLCFTCLWLAYPDAVENFVRVKLDPQGTRSTHIGLVKNSVGLFADNPLGYGFGTSSQVYEMALGVAGYNLHSSWMTFLVEEGVLGFSLHILMVLVVVLPLLKSRDMLSNACAAGYIAVVVGAIFYNTLNIMFAQYYPILILSFLESQKRSPGKS